MAGKAKKDQDKPVESSLTTEQFLKYADDIAKIYEEEKDRRKELEDVNDELRREILERKRAESALRESEERFRAIFETAIDSIYIKSPSLRYTHINPATEELLQSKEEDVIGKTDEEIYGKEIGLRLKEVDRRVLAGESIEEEQVRVIKGERVTLLETKVPLRDSLGRIVGLCGIARDITDRRRHESPAEENVSSDFPSTVMRNVLAKARLVGAQESLVLLLGESGAGKDWMARYIHEHSERKNGPFFAINCATVAHELAESELFGHERGAFTGANARKRGLLELAEGGTLHLNEIGELALPMQAKLLDFLDSMCFTRVGGETKISVNTRLVSATNRDLEHEVKEGRFRHDLFHRLNVMVITIPPLRQRRDDLPVLVERLLEQLCNRIRLSSPPIIGPEVMAALKAYDWPGNVRELRNILERALLLSGGGKVAVSHLGLQGQTTTESWEFKTSFPEGKTLNDITRDLKRSLVMESLRRTKDNRTEAARLLGISRNSLNHYLATLNMED